jgi:hypothetical protein
MDYPVSAACKLLNISERTFYRYVKAGKIKVTHSETEHTRDGRARIFVEESTVRALLGLPAELSMVAPQGQPKENRAPEVILVRQYEDEVPRIPALHEPGTFDPQQSDPTEFRDSFGHLLTGNQQHRMFATRNDPPVDKQSHMNPALLATSGETKRWSFDCGLGEEDLAKMKSEWRRRGGGLSMSEQREKQERSVRAIQESFPKAQRT